MENKIMEQRNCFAYHPKQCRILTEMLCKKKKCPFFKTREQFIEGLKKYPPPEHLRCHIRMDRM